VPVRPTRYCLSYPTADGCCRPANWSLSASVDGEATPGEWTALCAQADDRSLIKADRASWPIPDQGQAFKHFQVTCTGADDSATPPATASTSAASSSTARSWSEEEEEEEEGVELDELMMLLRFLFRVLFDSSADQLQEGPVIRCAYPVEDRC
jgi:hypothetical protein